MKKRIVLLGLLGLTMVAQAALVLELDVANEQVRFTGSDSGITDYMSGLEGYMVEWRFESGLNGGAQTLDSLIGADFFSESTDFGEGFTVFHYENSGTTILLQVGNSEEITALTGGETWVDYSGLGATFKTDLESMAGGTLAFHDDKDWRDWSSISVQAVPEPASALLTGIGTGALLLIRRWGNP